MKYEDGSLVKVGDKVQLWEGCTGIIVCSFDTDDYSEGYDSAEWRHLERGVLIQSDKAGLVHYESPDEDFLLLERFSCS